MKDEKEKLDDIENIEPNMKKISVRGTVYVIEEMPADKTNKFMKILLEAEAKTINAWLAVTTRADSGEEMNANELQAASMGEVILLDELFELSLPENAQDLIAIMTPSERRKVMENVLEVNTDIKDARENFTRRLELTLLKRQIQSLPESLISVLTDQIKGTPLHSVKP